MCAFGHDAQFTCIYFLFLFILKTGVFICDFKNTLNSYDCVLMIHQKTNPTEFMSVGDEWLPCLC